MIFLRLALLSFILLMPSLSFADTPQQTFNDPSVTAVDYFGSSVAIDGNNLLIGVPQDDTNGTNVGQAHLFDITVPEPATGFLLLGMSLIAGACRRSRSTCSKKPFELSLERIIFIFLGAWAPFTTRIF